LKVIVNIATHQGREATLTKTIDSIKDQCDAVNVYDNSNNEDYTDNAKFFFLDLYKEPCYYLTCDSDIIYPPNYCASLKYWIDTFQCPVSFHGRIINTNIAKYYASGHQVFDFRHGLLSSKYVDVIGTGVMGFRTDHYHPKDLHLSPYKRMSDLVFSLQAKKDGARLVCAEHSAYWLTQQVVEDSIQQSESQGTQAIQIKLMNEILNG